MMDIRILDIDIQTAKLYADDDIQTVVVTGYDVTVRVGNLVVQAFVADTDLKIDLESIKKTIMDDLRGLVDAPKKI